MSTDNPAPFGGLFDQPNPELADELFAMFPLAIQERIKAMEADGKTFDEIGTWLCSPEAQAIVAEHPIFGAAS